MQSSHLPGKPPTADLAACHARPLRGRSCLALAFVLALASACGSSPNGDEQLGGGDTEGEGTTDTGEGPSGGDGDGEGEGDGDGDPFACEAWPEVEPNIGAGPTVALSFVDATAELGLGDVAYYAGEWPPGCSTEPDGALVETPCRARLEGGGVAVGDYDEDGWPDVYLSRLDGPGRLFRNLLGDGGDGFVELGAELGLVDDFAGNGAAWVDVDGDDDLDLYVTSLDDPGRFWFYQNLLRESGSASFIEAAHDRGLALDDGHAHLGFSIAVGDYDGDGWLDLYTGEWYPNSSAGEDASHARLLRNLGAGDPGRFEDRTADAGASMWMQNPAGIYAFAPAFVDLDEDRRPDLTVVSDESTSRLFWNRGDGTVQDGTPKAGVGLDQNGMGSTFGDFDGDGHLDWYVSAICAPPGAGDCGGKGGNRLYRSVGTRCFEEVALDYGLESGDYGWGTAMFDPDNDGDLDLVETNGFAVPWGLPGTIYAGKSLRFWRNESESAGVAEFSEIAADVGLIDQGQGRGLVVFDYDRDGDDDLLIVDNSNAHGTGTKLWRNETVTQNAWLAVELDGPVGNRQGVGARIELRRELDGPVQIRVIGVGTHYLGHGENRASFGLGPDVASVAELRISWPSGEQTVLTDVASNQILEVAPG